MKTVNFSKANTSTFKRYSDTHEELGNLLKVVSIGLGLIDEANANKIPVQELWSKLEGRGRSWGTKPTITSEITTSAYYEIANLGLARSFSAFDAFLIGSAAELDSYSTYDVMEMPSGTNPNTDDDGLEKAGMAFKRFYRDRGFKTSDINFLIPVFDYYTAARNCIIHRSGIASRELNKCVVSHELAHTVENWISLTGEHGPLRLKSFNQGDRVKFDYFDAILSSSVLRLLALNLNSQIVARVGVEGLTVLAAKYFIKQWRAEPPITIQNTATKVIPSHLSSVNRVEGVNWRFVEPLLNQLGMLQACVKAFNKA